MSGKRPKTTVVCCAGPTVADGWYLFLLSCAHFSYCFGRSQSRMRGDYLFYEEKIETTQEERDAKAARRYVPTLSPGQKFL